MYIYFTYIWLDDHDNLEYQRQEDSPVLVAIINRRETVEKSRQLSHIYCTASTMYFFTTIVKLQHL